MANLLNNSRACMAAAALAKAQAFRGRGGCAVSCSVIDSTVNKPVPPVSNVLTATVKDCYDKYPNREGCVPDSVRIARLQQRTIDLSRDPNDPSARFSEFRRPFIQICPPIPQWYYTAGEPVLQGPCKIGTDSAEVALVISKNPNDTAGV